MNKKKGVEQNGKSFQKVIRKAKFFTKDLDLGLFDPFKDVKDGVLLYEEDIAIEDKATKEEAGKEAQDVGASVLGCCFFVYLHFSFVVGFWPHFPCNYDSCYFFSMNMFFLR